MKLFFKIMFVISILFSFIYNTMSLNIERIEDMPVYEPNYMINQNGNKYPKIYMGYSNQIKNGPYFGLKDLSAVITPQFNKKFLIFNVKKRDNIKVYDKRIEDSNKLIIKYKNNDYYIQWGDSLDGKIEVKSNISAIIKRETLDKQILYEIKIPWGKITFFKKIPLKINFVIYDNDKYNSKKMVLSESYYSLYFNILNNYLHVENPSFFTFDSKKVINFEINSDTKNSSSLIINLNGKNYKKNISINKGANKYRLILNNEKLLENNKLDIKYEDLSSSINFKYFESLDIPLNNYRYKQIYNEAKKTVQVKKSLIDNQKYKLFLKNNTSNRIKNLVLIDKWDSLLEIYSNDSIRLKNMYLFKIKKQFDRFTYFDLIEIIKNFKHPNNIVNLILWDINIKNVLSHFLKNPLHNDFNIIITDHYKDNFSFFDDILKENMGIFNITYIYNSFNNELLEKIDNIKYIKYNYIDENEIFNRVSSFKFEPINNYNYFSSNITNNWVDGIEILELKDYSQDRFGVSVESLNSNINIYTRNLSLFSLKNGYKNINIDDKNLKSNNKTKNYYIFNKDSSKWQKIKDESRILPNIKSFFTNKITCFDENTQEYWLKNFKRDTNISDKKRVIYYNKTNTIPELLMNNFKIRSNQNGFYTMGNNFIKYEDNYIVLFRNKEKVLLMFNYMLKKFIYYPFNFILLDKKGEFQKGGGLILK